MRNWCYCGGVLDFMGKSLVQIEASKWKVSCEDIRNKQGRPVLLLGSQRGQDAKEERHQK
jgi:hypothetical protein